MMVPFGFELFWGLVAIEVLGLFSAVVVQLSEGSRRHGFCQAVFFACLLLTGAMTIVSLAYGEGLWVGSGTTLAVMVLTATMDVGREAEREGPA